MIHKISIIKYHGKLILFTFTLVWQNISKGSLGTMRPLPVWVKCCKTKVISMCWVLVETTKFVMKCKLSSYRVSKKKKKNFENYNVWTGPWITSSCLKSCVILNMFKLIGNWIHVNSDIKVNLHVYIKNHKKKQTTSLLRKKTHMIQIAELCLCFVHSQKICGWSGFSTGVWNP